MTKILNENLNGEIQSIINILKILDKRISDLEELKVLK